MEALPLLLFFLFSLILHQLLLRLNNLNSFSLFVCRKIFIGGLSYGTDDGTTPFFFYPFAVLFSLL